MSREVLPLLLESLESSSPFVPDVEGLADGFVSFAPGDFESAPDPIDPLVPALLPLFEVSELSEPPVI